MLTSELMRNGVIIPVWALLYYVVVPFCAVFFNPMFWLSVGVVWFLRSLEGRKS